MQVECSTDLAFRSEAIIKPLCEASSREAILSVKVEQVMNFLGRKMSAQRAQELNSRLSTRIEGPCIKHRLGKKSVKMYDKFGRVLRIETTTNEVSFLSITARWNTGMDRTPGNSPRSRSRSIA